MIEDPWGNVFSFEAKEQKDFEKKIDDVRPKMRAYIQAQIDAGREVPTPEEVREIVGPPLGAAIEILNEFPGYNEIFEARTRGDDGSRR